MHTKKGIGRARWINFCAGLRAQSGGARQVQSSQGLFVAVAATLALVACGSADPTERTGQTQSPLTTFTFGLPRGAQLRATAIAGLSGSGWAHINDRAKVISYANRQIRNIACWPGLPCIPEQIFPVVAGNNEVQVGAGSEGATVLARGPVTIRSNGKAASVTTSGGFSAQDGASAGSFVETNAPLNPVVSVPISLTLPTGNPAPAFHTGSFLRNSEGEPIGLSQVNIAPGAYSGATVDTGGQLNLTAGTYSFQNLDVEPEGQVFIDNSAGPVNIYVSGSLIYRGVIFEQLPESANVLFVYAGQNSVTLEGAFRGVFIAPFASLMIHGGIDNLLGTNSKVHVGAFFATSVELFEDNFVLHRPLDAWAHNDCHVANFTEVLDDPNGSDRGFLDMDPQGVTHSGDIWYFSNAGSSVCPCNSLLCIPDPCDFSHLWSFPASVDPGGVPSLVVGNPWEGQYNHFGGLAFRFGTRQPVDDYVLIPLEPGNGGDSTLSPALGIFSSSLQSNAGFKKLTAPPPLDPAPAVTTPASPGAQGSFPWVAFDTTTRHIFTSGFNPDSDGPQYQPAWLNEYNLTVVGDVINGVAAPANVIAPVRSLRYADCRTGAPSRIYRLQGGAFSPRGLLFLTTDTAGDTESSLGRGGVLIVDPQTGRIRDFFQVNYLPHDGEELEGITVWNPLSFSPIPGQVHVQMNQNHIFQDNFFFKHYQADIGNL